MPSDLRRHHANCRLFVTSELQRLHDKQIEDMSTAHRSEMEELKTQHNDELKTLLVSQSVRRNGDIITHRRV